MARNRKSQPAAVRLAPALKALVLCVFIGGSGLGYVWQKNQIMELGQQIKRREVYFAELQRKNNELSRQLALLRSPRELDARARKLNLGLLPHRPEQVLRLDEAAPVTAPAKRGPQYVAR